jgi:hypothetical protein
MTTTGSTAWAFGVGRGGHAGSTLASTDQNGGTARRRPTGMARREPVPPPRTASPASRTYCGDPAAASPARAAPSMAAVAESAPTTRWRDEPRMAKTAIGSSSVYSPVTTGIPAIFAYPRDRESARPAGHAIKDRGKQVNHHASAGSTRH